MAPGDVGLVLIYEPHTVRAQPVLLARVDNPLLVARVAEAAIGTAQRRAAELGRIDGDVGDAEAADAARLTAILRLLIPGLNTRRAIRH
jgi:hypothetical protein